MLTERGGQEIWQVFELRLTRNESLIEFEASPQVDRKADKNCSLERFWGEI